MAGLGTLLIGRLLGWVRIRVMPGMMRGLPVQSPVPPLRGSLVFSAMGVMKGTYSRIAVPSIGAFDIKAQSCINMSPRATLYDLGVE